MTAMIIPNARDPRFISIRRSGSPSDSDHRLLALWAASCAEHVRHLFESAQPEDAQPREALEAARAWVRGEVKKMQARASHRADVPWPIGRCDEIWDTVPC